MYSYVKNSVFIYPMDKLEFENQESKSDDSPPKRRNEIFDLDLNDQAEEGPEQQSLAIEFSKRVVEALDEKMESHNKAIEPSRINLVQLKRVYKNGAEIFSKIYKESYPEKTCGLWALARVNMYLRMRLGKVIESGKQKNVDADDFLDISASWTPMDEDFSQAKEDIKKYKLNYKFDNVNELYLDEYERLDIYWG